MLEEHADEERLRADFVWLPAWGQENYALALNNMPTNPDPRARVWYDEELVLGFGLAQYMPSMDAPVYDMYLIYSAGGTWQSGDDDNPGEPSYMQHGHSESFNGDDFWAEVEPLLPQCDEVLSQ